MKQPPKSCCECGGPVEGLYLTRKCFWCMAPRQDWHYSPVRQCWTCGKYMHTSLLHYCGECRKDRQFQHPAQVAARNEVAKAVKSGRLPRAKDCVCVDCGRKANEYDHRDYDKPLDVEPVCHPCNIKRGFALQTRPKFGPLAEKAA